MENILIQAEALAKSIKESNAYREYQVAFENLKKSEEIYKKLCEFKKNQMNDRLNEFNNHGNGDLGQKKFLSKLYSDLLLNETAREFLLKEKYFLDNYEKVFLIIGGAAKIEMFEFDNLK